MSGDGARVPGRRGPECLREQDRLLWFGSQGSECRIEAAGTEFAPHRTQKTRIRIFVWGILK
jgi:hypothetical protein